jgi:hypothetical protein
MQQPTQSESPMNLNNMHKYGMAIVESVCTVFTMPVEMVLRPQYGTRYFSPPLAFFSTVLMVFLPLFSSTAEVVTHMIPFARPAVPSGMFGLASLSSLYFFLLFLHGFRLWRRMVYMHLEQYSEFEGPALPVFPLIPGGRSFWITRIFLEPIVVYIVATLLQGFGIFQSGLTTFLHLAAIMLCIKEFIVWYRNWEFIRVALDGQAIGTAMSKILQNKATRNELEPMHLASFPKDLPADLRDSALRHFVRSFMSEIPTVENQKEEKNDE